MSSKQNRSQDSHNESEVLQKRIKELEEAEAKYQKTRIELQASEEIYRFLFEKSQTLNLLVGLDGNILKVNKLVLELFDLDEKEIIGKDPLDFVVPEQREIAKKVLFEELSGGITPEFEVEVIGKNGIKKILLFTEGHGTLYQNGEIVGILISAIDITNRKSVEEKLKEDEEKYRSLFQTSMDAIFFETLEGQILDFNDAACSMYGYDKNEMLTCSVSDLLPNNVVQTLPELVERLKKSGEVFVETEGKRKDGSIFPIEVHIRVVPFRGRNMICVFVRDITEQKSAEQTIRERERFLSDIFTSIQDGISILDTELNIIRVNSVIEKWYSYATPLDGKKCYEAFHSRNKPCKICPSQQTIKTGKTANEIVPLRDAKAKIIGWLDLFSFPLVEMATGRLIGVIEYVRDISARRKAETLQEAVYRISQALDSSPTLDDLFEEVHNVIKNVMPAENFYIALYDEKEGLLSFPYFVDEVDIAPTIPLPLGKGLTEYVIRQEKSLLCDSNLLDELMHAGEAELVGKQSKIWLGVPLKIEKRTIGAMVVQHYTNPSAYGKSEQHMLEFVSSQIAKAIEHKQYEEALQKSEEKYRNLFEESRDTVFISNIEGKLLEINKAGEALFGYSHKELLNIGIRKLYQDPAERDIFVNEITSKGFVRNYNLKFRRKDGEIIECIVSAFAKKADDGVTTLFQGIISDITDIKRLEEQFRQSQKMEAIGRLAGGVAHDFNNMLTAIIGYCDLGLMSLSARDPLYKNFTEIGKAAHRAEDLVRQLLAYSRKQALEPKVLDLNLIITEMEEILQRLIGEDIELKTLATPNLWKVMVDPIQIEQVIVNLAVNARDAMPGGGKLSLETANVELNEEYTRSHPGSKAGPYVMLAVSDTGCGMSEEVREHIFDPFFTTKEVGKGTGLGLSTVYGIIKQSGGNIWVYSEEGQGTSFKIYLPKVEGEAVPSFRKIVTDEVPGGHETILIVEDEQIVRELAVKTLKNLGYKVYEAQNGEDAYLLAKQLEHPVDLVISDIVMPNMSGMDLGILLRSKVWSDVKILYISGYTENIRVQQDTMGEGGDYLQKPFRPSSLAQKVREVLDKK